MTDHQHATAQRFPQDPAARMVLRYVETRVEDPTDETVVACATIIRDLAQAGYLVPPVHHDDRKLASAVAAFLKPDRPLDLSRSLQEAADELSCFDPDVGKAYLRILTVINDADGVDPHTLAELLIGGTDGEAAAKLLVSVASDAEEDAPPARQFLEALTPPAREWLLSSLPFVLADAEIVKLRAAFARHRPSTSILKPSQRHQAVRSPSGNAEFDQLGSIDKIDWLAAEATKCTQDSEGVRLFLYGMPWKNLFLFFNALEPVVRSRKRRR